MANEDSKLLNSHAPQIQFEGLISWAHRAGIDSEFYL